MEAALSVMQRRHTSIEAMCSGMEMWEGDQVSAGIIEYPELVNALIEQM